MPTQSDWGSGGTRRLMARRCLGLATTEEHVDWAVAELVAGSVALSVAILAGLGRPLDRWEVAFYFERAMDELGLSLPEPREFLLAYARGIAGDILSGV